MVHDDAAATNKEMSDNNEDMKRQLEDTKKELVNKNKKLVECMEKLKKFKSLNTKQDAEIKSLNKHLRTSYKVIEKTEKINVDLRKERDLLQGINAAMKANKDIEEKTPKTDEEVLRLGKKSGHKRDSPASEAKKSESGKNQTCKICNFESKSEEQLRGHMTGHPDICDVCGVIFGTAGLLRRHLRIHHSENTPEYKCNKCKYEAQSKAQLKKHIENNHTDICEPEENKEEICKFWMRNSCMFGSQCKFKHPIACRYRQNCWYKESCKFYHVEFLEVDAPRRQCKFGERCSRPDCRYSHQQVECKYQERCNRRFNCSFKHFLVNRQSQHNIRQNSQKAEIVKTWRPWDL